MADPNQMLYRMFQKKLFQFKNKLPLQAETVRKKLALDLFRRFVERSPVDTGRFKASWRVGLENPDLSMEPAGHGSFRDPSGDAILRVKMGQRIWITNNVPYAIYLEHGHSQQAPAGIVSTGIVDAIGELERLANSDVS